MIYETILAQRITCFEDIIVLLMMLFCVKNRLLGILRKYSNFESNFNSVSMAITLMDVLNPSKYILSSKILFLNK